MADPQTLPLILRNSITAGAVPAATEFDLNTFVVNRNDGILYWRDAAGAVQSLNLKLPTSNAVRFDTAQNLSAAQKKLAKLNIGALGTGYQYLSADVTLTAAAAGNISFIQSGIKVTLPAMSSMKDGDMIMLRTWGAVGGPPSTIFANGSDVLTVNGVAPTSLTLRAGQDVLLVYNGGQIVVFGYATPQGDAPSYNEIQNVAFVNRRNARINLNARGGQYTGFSAAATLPNTYFGCTVGLFASAPYTITLPSPSSAGNGDAIEFTNVSAFQITLAVASGDTAANIYFGRGQLAKTLIVYPGQTVTLTTDTSNFIAIGYNAAAVGTPTVDFAQAFNDPQKKQLLTNIGRMDQVMNCRLVVASQTQLKLIPYQGNQVFINGNFYTLPVGGITLSNTGLSAGTTYNVYLTLVNNVLTLGTNPAGGGSDPVYGNDTIGGVGNVYVGTVYVHVDGQFYDDNVSRHLFSNFNRQKKYIGGTAVNSGQSGSTSDIVIGATFRVLSLNTDMFWFQLIGYTLNNTAGAATVSFIYIDGNKASNESVATPFAANAYLPAACMWTGTLTPGLHSIQPGGRALSGGVVTWVLNMCGEMVG